MKQLALLSLLVIAAPLHAQTGVDTSGAGRIIAAATEKSEVMENLRYLSDVIGPRLAGTAAMKKSNDWTLERFKAYGLTGSLEAFRYGVTWERGPVQARLVAPFQRAVTAHSWAWTAGTGGRTLAGPVVRVNVASPESLQANLSKVKGAWLLTTEPANVRNPDGPPMTAADSQALRDRVRQGPRPQQGDTSEAARERRRQFQVDLPYLLRQAGALGRLTDAGKPHGLMNMSGSANSVSPLPNLVVAHEDYAHFARLIAHGVTPRFEASVTNSIGTTPVDQYNTIAEIRGTEKPDEVVILGAHLDSWDLGTGVTDNGTGSMVVLEAARAIMASGLKPKRTIRFILFGAEEEGLIGSRAYAAAHASEADRIQAVLVLDNGTGRITGQALQGRNQDEQLWRDLLAPVASLGAANVRQGNKGGTDHLAFIPYGVPGWNFDQESRGYNHTHHSQVDTYDHAVPDDLIQASAVMAVTAYQLANLPQLLARGDKTPVAAPVRPKPSAGLEKYTAR
jgi:hypothetical protein